MAADSVSDGAGFVPIERFEGARASLCPKRRLEEVRARARRFREEMLAQAPVPYYRSFELVRVPYPVRYGLLNACTARMPYMHIVNRMFVVQFRSGGGGGGVKTLLMSPSDVHANQATPFFARLSRKFGPFKEIGMRLMGPILGTVEEGLARTGLRPEQVDYISYDHLHTQDLRRWLGSEGRPGYFPNARLLVMRAEWETVQGLAPPQVDWYCPGGASGIDPARVIVLDGDVLLGEGVAILHTPGHTAGNHSFAVRTPEGVMVTSENGIGPDAYAPERSAIPGLRRFARDTGMEVVLNGNTLEIGLEQYISMVEEKEVAGPSARNPEFPNIVSSSEFASYWAFPGLRPTFAFGNLEFGAPA